MEDEVSEVADPDWGLLGHGKDFSFYPPCIGISLNQNDP